MARPDRRRSKRRRSRRRRSPEAALIVRENTQSSSVSVVDQFGFTRHICSRNPTFAMGPNSAGATVTFILQGGRVSCGVAESTLSFIKALDSAWKTLEPCDKDSFHHPQFMRMLFRWLRRHKGGVTSGDL